MYANSIGQVGSAVAAPPAPSRTGSVIAGFEEMLSRLQRSVSRLEGIAGNMLGHEPTPSQTPEKAPNGGSAVTQLEQLVGRFEDSVQRLGYTTERLSTL